MTREYDIDTELRQLFAKMVSGNITHQERVRLDDLQRERSRRMMPTFRS